MNIAICDDQAVFRQQLLNYISNHNNCDISTFQFCCGEDLIEEYKSGHSFDIVFLDIQMRELDGLNTAQIIRKLDKHVIIVFVTSFEQYVFESFKVDTFDYLLKPVTQDKFTNLFNRIQYRYIEQHQHIKIKTKNTVTSLKIQDIIYIESYKHKLFFYTSEKVYECVGNLSEYETKLTSYSFLRCHHGFLANMNHIKTIEESQIVFQDSKKIPMSIRKKTFCLKAYNDFLTRYIL